MMRVVCFGDPIGNRELQLEKEFNRKPRKTYVGATGGRPQRFRNLQEPYNLNLLAESAAR